MIWLKVFIYEIKLFAYDWILWFFLGRWGANHIMVHSANHPLSLWLAKWSHHIPNTHTCTLSQDRRRIKHACLMLQSPLMQLSVAWDPLAQQDGFLPPSPSLSHPCLCWSLCRRCIRVSPQSAHIITMCMCKIPHEDFLLQGQQTQSKTVLRLLNDNNSLNNDNLLRVQQQPKYSGSMWKAKEESSHGRLCDRPGHPRWRFWGHQDWEGREVHSN